MGKIYMAGDPHSQLDDYTIEEKEKTVDQEKRSFYDGTSQYQSMAKRKQLKKSPYGLNNKNPIQALAQAQKAKPMQRELGYERD